MGVSIDIDYKYGFRWTFSDKLKDSTVEKIIKFLYGHRSKDFSYINAQYDWYHKSREIVIGIEEGLECLFLVTCFRKSDIEELYLKDKYLKKSKSLNYLHNYIESCDSECYFCKQDFYDNSKELAKRLWEITERDDIDIKVEQDHHYDMIRKIYNFLAHINRLCEKGIDKINIDDVWNSSQEYLDNCEKLFKWHSVIFVSV